jgi:hypothetical protein
MCHTEHVFHRPCCHWGRERFVGEPCIRSRLVNGRHTGCSYRESLGSTNSNDYCCDCKYRQAKGGYWRPFADISNGGWAQIEKKAKQRASSSEYSPTIMKVSVRFISQIRINLTNSGSRPKIVVVRSEREIMVAVQVPLREGPEQHFQGFGTGELPSPVQRSTTVLLAERCQRSLLYLPRIIHA